MSPRFLRKRPFTLLCARLCLSPREAQIVECLFRDDKESVIARGLDMSPHTLRTHVIRLYQKLNVTSRMELVIRLYESFLSLTCEPRSPLPPFCSRYATGPLSTSELTAQEPTGGAGCRRVNLLFLRGARVARLSAYRVA